MNLSELRTEVRRRADQENTRFVQDAELNSYINASAKELYDLLVAKFEDYYLVDSTVTLTGTNNLIALPSNFYKLRGVDFSISGTEWQTVRPFMFSERNQLSGLGARLYGRVSGVRYRLSGNNIRLEPADNAAGTYRYWYIPRFTDLVQDTDQLTGVLDFEEYVIVDAAIKCLVKEESDTSALFTFKKELERRINTMGLNRDAGEAQRVSDVSDSEYYDRDAGFYG